MTVTDLRRVRPPTAGADLGEVLDEHDFGLNCWSGAPGPMGSSHRHDDIEVNIVEAGELEYVFGGRKMRVEEGHAALFWAAIPHQLIGVRPAITFWLTIPLNVALSRRLPENLISPLLRGQQLAADVDPSVRSRFVQWERDLSTQAPELRLAALLEIEAWLRRLSYEMEQGRGHVVGPSSNARLARVATMADYIAYRFAEPIQVADVAREASINKHYAMVLFRETVGMTLGEYLTERRIGEARRLLLTTDLPVNQVAFASGFGSESQFYAAFRRATAESPAAYRRRHAGLAETAGCPDPRRPPRRLTSPA